MEYLELSIIVSLIALLSPALTTLINNYYQIQRENIKNYELAKRNSLEDFVKTASTFRYANSVQNTIELQTSINNLYIYFKDVPSNIDELLDIDEIQFNTLLNTIVIKLSKQIIRK